MAPEKLGMSPQKQIRKDLNSHPHVVFPEAFACNSQLLHRCPTANSDATASSTTSFLGHNYLQPPPPQVSQFRQQWNANSRSSADDSEEDDVVDGREVTNLENIVSLSKISESDQNCRYGFVMDCGGMKSVMSPGRKEENLIHNVNESVHNDKRSLEIRINTNSENSCGFSGRRDGVYPSVSGKLLRAILADPLTGTLMEDAMILPCGHSYGSGGIQQILSMKACYTCSRPVSEDSISPNLSLRLAVQAFNREEGFHANTSKRRRERYMQEKGGSNDSADTDQQGGKRIQFPFAVNDRVIIKGNKRTPPRFFGREAVVTAECLNGWYVVETLDDAESVKLQYRSLAKLKSQVQGHQQPIQQSSLEHCN